MTREEFIRQKEQLSKDINYIYNFVYSKREKLKTTMSRVAQDKAGRHLPARLIGAVLSKRGMSVKPTGHKVDAK